MALRSKPDLPDDGDGLDVSLASTGDVAAFGRLYRRHVGRVNSLAEWMLGGSDTEDVLQEIFLRAWERLSTFRGEAAFGTWLHRLAVNVLLRYRETTRTHDRRFVHDDEAAQRGEPRWDGVPLYTEIESAVSKLPQRMRDVFLLHDMEGYKHDEIGEILGISAGTSRWHLHSARMALRQYFA